MTLLWTLVAAFLYVELAIVAILLTPIFNLNIWFWLVKNPVLKAISRRGRIPLYIGLSVIAVLCLNSLRDISKYKDHDMNSYELDTNLQNSMKLFRAHRNFYISSFALILNFIIKRVVLILNRNQPVTVEQTVSDEKPIVPTKTFSHDVITLRRKVLELETDLIQERRIKDNLKAFLENHVQQNGDSNLKDELEFILYKSERRESTDSIKDK